MQCVEEGLLSWKLCGAGEGNVKCMERCAQLGVRIGWCWGVACSGSVLGSCSGSVAVVVCWGVAVVVCWGAVVVWCPWGVALSHALFIAE